MEISTFEIFIQHCGTVEKAAKILGTSHQNISSMRNGRTWVKPHFALKIAKYLWEKAKYKINPLDLVSPLERNYLKSLSLPTTHFPIKLINVSITHVTCNCSMPKSIDREQLFLNQFRPIILDENFHIIANPSTYLIYQQQHKKTVPAWRLSLADLLERKYEFLILVQTFLISERVAIGIALENFLGERRGRKNVNNSARFNLKKGIKTRKFVANCLGFGSHFTYQSAKEIFKQGCVELIEKMDQKKLTISKASHLAKLTPQQQRNKVNQGAT